MSILRITEGEYITEIEKDWNVFTDEFEAFAGKFSYFSAAEETVFGLPQKDQIIENKYFKKAWWSLDREGNDKITQAGIGQTVFFHVITQNIKEQHAKVVLQLYDEDGGLGGQDDLINIREVKEDGSLGELVTEKRVINSKIIFNITLSDDLVDFIEDDFGDEIELYFECSYKEEQGIKLPFSSDLYLNVEICDKNVVQSFNNRQYGSCNFYRFRYDDFMRRHKHCKHMPPVYYFGEMRELSFWSIADNIEEWWTPSLTEEMKQVSVSVQEIEKQGNKYKPVPSTSYGFKYCIRFTQVLMNKLTERGQEWLTQARHDLQKFMEQGIIDKTYIATYDTVVIDVLEDNFNDNLKPSKIEKFWYRDDPKKLEQIQQDKMDTYYTNIELDNNRFQEFAFATHPDAYSPLKMQTLPLKDLIRVALTPDLKEWFGDGWWMTLKQAILVGSNYDMEEIERLISEFDLEESIIFLDEFWENIFN